MMVVVDLRVVMVHVLQHRLHGRRSRLPRFFSYISLFHIPDVMLGDEQTKFYAALFGGSGGAGVYLLNRFLCTTVRPRLTPT